MCSRMHPSALPACGRCEFWHMDGSLLLLVRLTDKPKVTDKQTRFGCSSSSRFSLPRCCCLGFVRNCQVWWFVCTVPVRTVVHAAVCVVVSDEEDSFFQSPSRGGSACHSLVFFASFGCDRLLLFLPYILFHTHQQQPWIRNSKSLLQEL